MPEWGRMAFANCLCASCIRKKTHTALTRPVGQPGFMFTNASEIWLGVVRINGKGSPKYQQHENMKRSAKADIRSPLFQRAISE